MFFKTFRLHLRKIVLEVLLHLPDQLILLLKVLISIAFTLNFWSNKSFSIICSNLFLVHI